MTKKQAQPFLKWAGGKTQLLAQIESFFPKELLMGSMTRYIEPFVGGGALFFKVANTYPIQDFIISDINPELILAYQTIQKEVEGLINHLWDKQKTYLALPGEERKNFFYQVRTDYNQQRNQINFDLYTSNWIERTAQLIFLNRTCFNGLFRVNSKGEFNVPFGRYKKPRICDADNLRQVAKILEQTAIHQGDFTQCKAFVDQASFVYFDPPYRPISKTSSFNAYSKQSFNNSEQLRLRDFFHLLDQKGAKLLLSNSDPKNEDPTDDFFENAYYPYRIERVEAARNINSNASKRGKIKELVIINY
ncbi:DNA adenine methylase [Halothece sp. PCC 7418]|uniref:DNA adenine methylase n=1 Tax=Halothece sp. (strain PCC 7418) TaxID=65093 RepID=UPI0002A06322|nr:DNA adenine methylase [Halothece sp. PCC 7418]AFZ43165.1 DNA adenine methylase [Halothece sp. PCC 7418]